ncbi:MAG: hypothetical protein HYV63_20545 [Candidatus Schekmanbacteria bacterium]|nr:hypothetical protein [Candidatus Schekmanbacteria bacterium]
MRYLRRRSPGARAIACAVLLCSLQLLLPGSLLVPVKALAAVFVSIQHEPVGNRIVGSDITFTARVTGDVEQVLLLVRQLAELGDYTAFAMDRREGGEYAYVLPLSQEPVQSRLEYYIEARKGGKMVAETERYTIGFIERPFVGTPQVMTTASLSKEEWKLLLRGGQQPWWKKWWVWAIAGVALAGTVAATVGGGGGSSVPALEQTVQGVFPSTRGNIVIAAGGQANVPVGAFGATSLASFSIAPKGGKPPYAATVTIPDATPLQCTQLQKDQVCTLTHTFTFNTSADYRTYTIDVATVDSAAKTVSTTLSPRFCAAC